MRLERDAGERRRQPRDLVHDLRRMIVAHRIAHGLADQAGDLPVVVAVLRRHDLAHELDAALGIDERAVLFQEGRAGQKHVRVVRRLVQEQVLHDDAFHRRKTGRDVVRVWVRLQDVLALHVESLERAVDGGVEHVRDAQARLGVERLLPQRFEHGAGGIVGDVPIAGELVRERAHVAGALHVVLPAQRVHADAGPADVAGRHGEIGDRHHRGRALAVLGDAEAVIDRAVAAGGVEPRRTADRLPPARRKSSPPLPGCCAPRQRTPPNPETHPSRSARERTSR